MGGGDGKDKSHLNYLVPTSVWQSLVLSHKLEKPLVLRLASCLGCGRLWVLWQGKEAAGSREGISKASGIERVIVQLLEGVSWTSKELPPMRGEAQEPVLCWDFQADESDSSSKGLVASSAHCREAYLSASTVLVVCAGHPAAVWGAGPASQALLLCGKVLGTALDTQAGRNPSQRLCLQPPSSKSRKQS